MIVDYIYLNRKRINIHYDEVKKIYFAKITISYDKESKKQIQKRFSARTIDLLKSDISVAFSKIERSSIINCTIEESLLAFVNLRYKNGKESTYDTNLRRIKSAIIPYIGSLQVQEFTSNLAQEFVDKIKLVYSSSYVHGAVSLLKMALDEHLNKHEIKYNPCIGLKLPLLTYKEATPLTLEESWLFIDACQKSKYREYFAVCLLTGMRLSEGISLTWDNINFSKKYIDVVSTIIGSRKITKRQMSTKGNAPRRIYPSDVVFDYLVDAAIKQIYQEASCEEWCNDTGYVFTQDDGQNLFVHHIQTEFNIIIKSIGLDKRRFHDLRHTFATLLWEESKDIESIKRLMGHRHTSTTLVYIHQTETTFKKFQATNELISAKIMNQTS